MKEFYKKHITQIWLGLIVITLVVGIFVDILLGLLGCLLIGIHFFFSLCYEIDNKFKYSDALGTSFVALLLHYLSYFLIISAVTAVVDTREIKTSQRYEIKYMEYETIVIIKNNEVLTIKDAKLYWECRAKNCDAIIETTISTVTSNPIFAKNLPHKELNALFSITLN